MSSMDGAGDGPAFVEDTLTKLAEARTDSENFSNGLPFLTTSLPEAIDQPRWPLQELNELFAECRLDPDEGMKLMDRGFNNTEKLYQLIDCPTGEFFERLAGLGLKRRGPYMELLRRVCMLKIDNEDNPRLADYVPPTLRMCAPHPQISKRELRKIEETVARQNDQIEKLMRRAKELHAQVNDIKDRAPFSTVQAVQITNKMTCSEVLTAALQAFGLSNDNQSYEMSWVKGNEIKRLRPHKRFVPLLSQETRRNVHQAIVIRPIPLIGQRRSVQENLSKRNDAYALETSVGLDQTNASSVT